MPNKNYIDQTFYNINYKPNIQASIQDQYTNGPRNAANFESYVERASELVNRLTDNTIENLGGIDSLTPTPQNYIKKATAAMVEYWYLNDFNIGIIDASFTAGAASADTITTKRVKVGNDIRSFIPETVLLLVQTSGLSKQTLIGVNSADMLADKIPGLSVKDVLTVDDAFTFFQQKGNYDNNFHKDLNIQGELTGSASKRYVLIGKSAVDQKRMTFGMIGGNELASIAGKLFVTVSVVTASPNQIDLQESAVVTLNPKSLINVNAPGEPVIIAKVNADREIEVYVELQSDVDIADILITDIAPDDAGVYAVHGSSLVDPLGVTIATLSVVQSASSNQLLQVQIDDNTSLIRANTNLINSKEGEITDLDKKISDVDTKADANKILINTNKDGISKNNSSLVTLGNTKLDSVDANDEFIRREKGTGFNTAMKSGYVATEKLDIVTKASLDVVESAAKSEAEQLRIDVTALQSEITAAENVWTGNQGLTGDTNEGTADFSSISGDDGVFDFTNGKTFYVSVFDTKTNLGGTVQVISGKSNFEVKSLASGGGTSESVGVKVGTDGTITVNESTTGIDVSQDIIIDRVSQPSKITASTGASIFATKASLALKQDVDDARLTSAGMTTNGVVDGVIENHNANKAISVNIGNKAILKTTAKDNLVNAINENFDKGTNNEANTKLLNAGTFDVAGDGTIKVQMFNVDGSLTDSFKALVGIRTDAEINALIDAKVNTIMDVTFDDNTGDQYKIGK